MTSPDGSGIPQDRILVHGDPDLRHLISGYLENRRREVPQLRAALARQDFDMLQRLGHRLKGEGGGYGFDDISAIGARMEEAAKEADVPKISVEVEALAVYLDRVEVVYP